ncbi:hypothetical protein BDW74DRAFT_183767 [Aspergillus multicolor]|uniref:uncharacterized protein n=1 Tax=Aspergillus multicolor TaxID=41759 RepID=UPI003CCE5393
MAGSEKPSHSDSNAPDLACTRCRERKIRCDRERPRCGNCGKDDGVVCIYQTPPKRVNHLKLLCDSVDQLHGRLSSIESHLRRLTLALDQGRDQKTFVPLEESITNKEEDIELWKDDADTDGNASVLTESGSQLGSEMTRGHVWYTGPHSMAALCGNLRQHILSSQDPLDQDRLAEKLQSLYEAAAATETVPVSDIPRVVCFPLKQEVMAAVERILEDGDAITDLFVRSHLLAQLELVYSRPHMPGDILDSWVICFKTIAVFALGMGIKTQDPGPTTPFANLAKPLLASRAALLASSLLTKPSLINVQVLILLSVIEEQSDPPELAESIFAQACMLARMIGRRQTHPIPHDDNDIETVEREMARRSLYIRDRSLCITRGTASWLPSHDCDFIRRLSIDVERERPYHMRVRLAMIQDEVYLLNQAAYTDNPNSRRSLAEDINSLERQLAKFAKTFAIFDLSSDSKFDRNVGTGLEFLATRILALRLSSQQDHMEQVRSDARASCLLLLLAANGARDYKVIDRFRLLISSVVSSTTSPVNNETVIRSMGRAMDAFSIPAYFFLGQDVVSDLLNDNQTSSSKEDLQLLRQVSECCTRFVSTAESNSYHRKVARVLRQVSDIIEFIAHSESDIPKCPSEDKEMTDASASGSSIPCPLGFPDTTDTPPGQGVQDAHWSIHPDNPEELWNNWVPEPSSLDSAPPSGVMNVGDVSYLTHDHVAQAPATLYTIPNGQEQPVYYQRTDRLRLNRQKRSQMDEWPAGRGPY